MAKDATDAEATLGRLASLGASSWADLVFYLPRRYRDYTRRESGFVAAYGPGGEPVRSCLRLRVLGKTLYDRDGQQVSGDRGERAFRATFMVRDDTGTQGSFAVFGNLYLWKDVFEGSEIEVAGEVRIWNGRWQVRNAERIPDTHRDRVLAVYPAKPGYLASDTIARGVIHALERHLDDAVARMCDALGKPESAVDGLAAFAGGLRGALIAVHAPESLAKAGEAREALTRLEALALLREARQTESRPDEPASALTLDSPTLRRLAAGLPYPLTADQRVALNEIVADLRSQRPMRRLLTGDVGCGKSICFQIPAVACQAIGHRAVILAPGQLMLEQLMEEFGRYFPGVPVAAVSAERKPDRSALAANPILVGTTALSGWCRAQGYRPDFLVVDEQHRHSREMRESLIAPHTNLLEASATPIPRSLALITHGGMDVSTLRHSPVAKRIETRIVLGTEEKRLVEFVARALASGWRLALVYGRVDEEDAGELRSAKKELEAWERRFPGNVGIVHGRMTERQKQSVMRRIRAGEIPLLVASTVIELGLTLPSLRALVVVNAERFGLATLHQLRGRVAREGGAGKFLMFLPANVSEDARARLDALVSTEDGFELAEQDMKARGFGDLSPRSQAQTGQFAGLFSGIVVTPSDLEEARALGTA